MSDKKKTILKALNTLALALTDHHHAWTADQRAAYEQAVKALRKK